MRFWIIIVLCIGVVFPRVSSGAEKSHSLSIVRGDTIRMNKKYVKQYNGNLVKKDKGDKVLNGNITILIDVDGEDIKCKVAILENRGGKYVKAPVDIPKKSLCEHMETNEVVWPCIQNHTNIPKRCPIPKGDYWMKDMDPNDCDFGQNLPPNMAENYKVEITFWKGLEELAFVSGYGKLKKKMSKGLPKGPGRF